MLAKRLINCAEPVVKSSIPLRHPHGHFLQAKPTLSTPSSTSNKSGEKEAASAIVCCQGNMRDVTKGVHNQQY